MRAIDAAEPAGHDPASVTGGSLANIPVNGQLPLFSRCRGFACGTGYRSLIAALV